MTTHTQTKERRKTKVIFAEKKTLRLNIYVEINLC